MGNSQSFDKTYTYHTPLEHVEEGSSPIYRASSHPDALIKSFLDRDVTNAWDLFAHTVNRFPRRRFLGRRFRDKDGHLGPYLWMTYTEAHQIALAFGTTLVKEEIIVEHEYPDEAYPAARKMKILGLYAKNCVEWFLAEQACNAYNFTLCPLYDTLGEDAMDFILKQTKMVVALAAFDCFSGLLRVLVDPATGERRPGFFLKTVILIDPETPDDARKTHEHFRRAIEAGRAAGLDILMWHEVVSRGVETAQPTPGTRESVNTVCYTSGTTGMPKGVLLPHGMIAAVVIGAARGPISPSGIFEVGTNDTILSYLPLAHVFERCVCNVVISKGGAIGMYSGDMAKLLEDVKALNPSVFISVPRLFNRINDKIAMSLMEKKLPTQILFNQGLNSKVSRRRSESATTHRVWDAFVFGKIRSMMGTSLRGMICGGAPLDPNVCERMTAFFSVPLMQGYGLTESFGPCFLMHPDDNCAGYIGGVWPAVEFKLISVPELNYFVSDRPARGELCLRGPGISPGYFCNKEDTQAAWDTDGWFHTGDIATLHERTLAVAIIDRKKNIFKLSQGEYIAPDKIEAIYSQAAFVSQIFVFGYSHEASLVAIVVPDAEYSTKWAKNNNTDTELTVLVKSAAFKQAVMADMEDTAKKLDLKGFEKAKDIYITADAFTVENNLLTPTSKIRRADCKTIFQAQIDEMYAKMNNKRS